MHISIIGTGHMAQYLAQGWLKAGHTIQFGSRQPDTKANMLAQMSGATVTSNEVALQAAEVVVIAIPFTAVKPFAQQQANLLRNKLVIDISNPFDNLPDNRISGPEITAQAIGEGARVVAAFKANFWQTLLEPIDPKTGLVRDVHYVSDSDADKAIVAQLIKDLGFQPVDCGALRNARVLDGMVPLIVELDRLYGNGERRLSWKLLG
jgi:predicted dinucleotide-binding enzyme